MQRFKNLRGIAGILKRAKELDYETDTRDYNLGSDFIWLYPHTHQIQIAVNPKTGEFYIWRCIKKTAWASDRSKDMYGHPLYNSVLDIIYKPEGEE